LSIWRKGIIKDYPIVLGELPQAASENQERKPASSQDKKYANLGLKVQSLDDQRRKELGVKFGVVVAHAEALAARAGLQTEDLILSINNQDINSEQEFNNIISKIDAKKPIVFLAKRGTITQYIAIAPR
jgi:serine protease Do